MDEKISENKYDELHKKLDKILEEQKNNWEHLVYAGGKFYQSLEKVGIEGRRSTEKRFEDYEIKKYLNKEKSVLDIGANTCFFSLNISEQVKEIDCVEINKYLVQIGKEVRDFLKIENVNFFTTDFKNFVTDKKYDIVMSFAVDEVADGLSKLSFEDYLDKILNLLKEEGMIFFESQAEDIMLNKFDKKFNILKEKFNIIFKKEIGSTYPTNIKNRVFLIGVKK